MKLNQEEAIRRVIKKLTEVNDKHPLFHSDHEGYAVMKEEVDELWDEVKKNRKLEAKIEAIDVAVTAIRFLMS